MKHVPKARPGWPAFVVGSLFGWKRSDGLRRFRTAYVEVARKNGKSLLLAGTALYALIADGEPGAHVYSAATTRDQARTSSARRNAWWRQVPRCDRGSRER